MSDFTIYIRRERANLVAHTKEARRWISINIDNPRSNEFVNVGTDVVDEMRDRLLSVGFSVEVV